MTSERELVEVDNGVGGVVSATVNSRADSGGPVIVGIHGSGYTSRYFDLPEMSLLEDCAREELLCVALDRPGYGGSDIGPDGFRFASVAGMLDHAVTELWRRFGAGHTGVVVVAHSVGAAVAVHLAARVSRWPLIGLALSGVGDVSPGQVSARWRSLSESVPVDLSGEDRRRLLYGPDWSVRPDVVEQAACSTSSAPTEELLEIVDGWFADLNELAPRVICPLQYVLAEYDALRIVSRERLNAFADRFCNSSYVERFIFRGAGHNIDHHHLGRAFRLQQIAFALRCSETALCQATSREGAATRT
ncbi:MAG TPA: alpha/beta hydrolase [Solirubrobacteraceae bacterium]|jgi:pimeloyl-ACP methyl ester carboxylesterase|nr:alpha/beta hydrolase [Solirubrobacteraceae bacterium]